MGGGCQPVTSKKTNSSKTPHQEALETSTIQANKLEGDPIGLQRQLRNQGSLQSEPKRSKKVKATEKTNQSSPNPTTKQRGNDGTKTKGGPSSKTKEGKENGKTSMRSSASSRVEDDVRQMWIEDEVARLKSTKAHSNSPVHYVNGKLVIREDSESSSDDEIRTAGMTA